MMEKYKEKKWYEKRRIKLGWCKMPNEPQHEYYERKRKVLNWNWNYEAAI